VVADPACMQAGHTESECVSAARFDDLSVSQKLK
jgi:hypothetical protein